MSTFTKVSTRSIIRSNCKTIEIKIVKYKKDGTSRTFFRPEHLGNPVSKTFFARMYDAESTGRAFIKFKLEKAVKSES
jgi:hypothetical protein